MGINLKHGIGGWKEVKPALCECGRTGLPVAPRIINGQWVVCCKRCADEKAEPKKLKAEGG